MHCPLCGQVYLSVVQLHDGGDLGDTVVFLEFYAWMVICVEQTVVVDYLFLIQNIVKWVEGVEMACTYEVILLSPLLLLFFDFST